MEWAFGILIFILIVGLLAAFACGGIPPYTSSGDSTRGKRTVWEDDTDIEILQLKEKVRLEKAKMEAEIELIEIRKKLSAAKEAKE